MIIGIFLSNLPIFWFFTACQPPALTLKRQTYRHVDHIEFENPGLVDDFLAYWRNTGNQRAGFLYGRYERYTKDHENISVISHRNCANVICIFLVFMITFSYPL